MVLEGYNWCEWSKGMVVGTTEKSYLDPQIYPSFSDLSTYTFLRFILLSIVCRHVCLRVWKFPWVSACTHRRDRWYHIPWSWRQKERHIGNGRNLLKLQSPSPVTSSKTTPPNPSQTLTPIGTKSSNRKSIGNFLLKTATKTIPICTFLFIYILSWSSFFFFDPNFFVGRNYIYLRYPLPFFSITHFLFSSWLSYFLLCFLYFFPFHLFFYFS